LTQYLRLCDVHTGRSSAVAGSSCETDDSEQYVPEFQSHHHTATSGMLRRDVEIKRSTSLPQLNHLTNNYLKTSVKMEFLPERIQFLYRLNLIPPSSTV
jgi:hypothetical protein